MLNLSVVGQSAKGAEYSWNDRDVMLYALAVGASQDDPLSELQFTTENSTDCELQVLPTFVALVAQQAANRPSYGQVPPGVSLHAGESFTQHLPLPRAATITTTTTVTGIYDKGSGALVTLETDVVDASSGVIYSTGTSNAFIRGEGGFGGDRGPSGAPEHPQREPDHTVTYTTRSDQALIYRLTGDRNPLHSDPVLARKRGTDRPILHGMCTYGFTGRALLHAFCGGKPEHLAFMSGRFTKPVVPGDELTVQIWATGDEALYRTTTQEGVVVLAGECTRSP